MIHVGRARRWPRAVVVSLLSIGALAACGDDDGGGDAVASTSTTGAAGEAAFCEVHPRFAEELNMALANADPDTEQRTVIPGILDQLEPIVAELRAAEPDELDGVVDAWHAGMERFVEGQPVEPAERARQAMTDWVAANC